MRTATSFDPAEEVILVEAKVGGPLGEMDLTLVLDTGCAVTMLVPEVVDELGYSVRDGGKLTSVHSAIGREYGYSRHVSRFAALGFEVTDCDVHVFDLPGRYGIDGLLGLSFLRRFNYEIRSAEGVILASPIDG